MLRFKSSQLAWMLAALLPVRATGETPGWVLGGLGESCDTACSDFGGCGTMSSFASNADFESALESAIGADGAEDCLLSFYDEFAYPSPPRHHAAIFRATSGGGAGGACPPRARGRTDLNVHLDAAVRCDLLHACGAIQSRAGRSGLEVRRRGSGAVRPRALRRRTT
jgi:hypothetical protein